MPKHFLRRCLLLLLAEREDYGYDLVLRLEALGFGVSDPGGVYRALRAMEREELLRSAWRPSGVGPYRRVYEMTHAGRDELVRGAREITVGHELVERFIERYARLTSPARASDTAPASGETTLALAEARPLNLASAATGALGDQGAGSQTTTGR